MPINFPQNPSLGDTYQIGSNTFVFNGTVWEIGGTGNLVVSGASLSTTVSNVAPAASNPGDIWLNSESGIALTYFDDGDSQQWVQLNGSGIGFTGSQGPAGSTGGTGFVGSQGIQGNTGFVGSQGDIGYTGSQGSTGDTGFVGSQGAPGDTGFTGSQGAGFTGSQGSVGFTGSAGTGGGGAVYDVTTSSTGFFAMPSGNNSQRPASPVAGMVRFNTQSNQPEWYNVVGQQWINFYQNPAGTAYTVTYYIIAGGGGGGNDGGGGGGAGGYLTGNVSVNPGSNYTITIGAGGARQVSGSNSLFDTATAIGGGLGATRGGAVGGGGGSGGGGAADRAAGTGTAGQGNDGGTGYVKTSVQAAGGGGGATQIGQTGNSTLNTAGNGGAGVQIQVGSALNTYAGGGGGGIADGTRGVGGAGGGGNAGSRTPSLTATEGTANTGGGGGGGGAASNTAGAAGGSGIVIVRYLGTLRGSGGSISTHDGYTYHVFTTSSVFAA